MSIPDKIFKSLKHQYKGYDTFKSGQVLEEGYKPDYVLKKGNNYIILESEGTTSRKGYVGGMIKAAHFLTNERQGKLLFVIAPKTNTKAVTIAKHLNKYFKFIKGSTNLKAVYVIEATKYYDGEKCLAIDCEDFKLHALKV